MRNTRKKKLKTPAKCCDWFKAQYKKEKKNKGKNHKSGDHDIMNGLFQ